MKAVWKLTPLAVLAITACSDAASGPVAEVGADMSKYVAMGTSVSMGVASDGVVASSQQASWPKLLASDVGVGFSLPLISAPGCKPPLAAPLGNLRRVDGSFVSDASVCAQNVAGFTLPTQNVAISGATAGTAFTVASSAQNPLYQRVLGSGQTQLTAMLSLNPTFVSVEFGSNELLPALNGSLGSAESFSVFSANYTAIMTGVISAQAHALLALLPTDLRKFPALRTGSEVASQRTAFAARNVSVNVNCNSSASYVSLPGKIVPSLITAAVRASAGLGPLDLSCAEVPGTADGILTEADMTALNAQASQMNAFIVERATANGYATFSLGSLYDTAKDGVAFDLNALLTSNTPFGSSISLDGVHPSAAGQAVLASAAKAAILQKYGSISR